LDAIVATSAAWALPVLSVLRGRGIRVPGDIAFLCFDDQPEFSYCEPTVSIVDTPLRELGEAAAASALRRAAGVAEPDRIEVEARLRLRESCGCEARAPAGAPGRASAPDPAEAIGPFRERLSRVADLGSLGTFLTGERGDLGVDSASIALREGPGRYRIASSGDGGLAGATFDATRAWPEGLVRLEPGSSALVLPLVASGLYEGFILFGGCRRPGAVYSAAAEAIAARLAGPA